jgi:hypothetical protein
MFLSLYSFLNLLFSLVVCLFIISFNHPSLLLPVIHFFIRVPFGLTFCLLLSSYSLYLPYFFCLLHVFCSVLLLVFRVSLLMSLFLSAFTVPPAGVASHGLTKLSVRPSDRHGSVVLLVCSCHLGTSAPRTLNRSLIPKHRRLLQQQ